MDAKSQQLSCSSSLSVLAFCLVYFLLQFGQVVYGNVACEMVTSITTVHVTSVIVGHHVMTGCSRIRNDIGGHGKDISRHGRPSG